MPESGSHQTPGSDRATVASAGQHGPAVTGDGTDRGKPKATAGDPESLYRRLRSDANGEREAALAELREMLLVAARREVVRRFALAGPTVRTSEVNDLAEQSADDALVELLRKLDEFRGESRFTTWAWKFAVFSAGNRVRRRSWRGRELPVREEAWDQFRSVRVGTERRAEDDEVLIAIREEIEDALSPHQHEVLVAVTLNDVPIDVLAERLHTTRGALYKTLHDARRNLREALARRGLDPAAYGRDPDR